MSKRIVGSASKSVNGQVTSKAAATKRSRQKSKRIPADVHVRVIEADEPDIVESDPAPNPFDLERLRLSQDFGASIGVKKVLTTVRVCKPHKQWFVRTHSSADYRCDAVVLEMDDEGEMYWVDPLLWDALVDEPTIIRRRLITAITTQGNVFVWPIGLPDIDGKLNGWHESALAAAGHAAGCWCRIISNRQVGAYEVAEARGVLKEPQWPALNFQSILELAFRDRCITTMDHPALRKLRGES